MRRVVSLVVILIVLVLVVSHSLLCLIVSLVTLSILLLISDLLGQLLQLFHDSEHPVDELVSAKFELLCLKLLLAAGLVHDIESVE